MPRELIPEIEAMIESGHCEDHTAVVITLGDGSPPLRFATAEQQVGSDVFLGKLRESQGLKMSLTAEFDQQIVEASNVDKVLGQQLTSVSNALEGATAKLGTIFVDEATGDAFFDEKLPCDVFTGAVDENGSALELVADIYSPRIVGVTVASVFTWNDRVPVESIQDPNDIPRGPFDPHNPFDPWQRDGRIPGYDLPILQLP